MEFDSFTEKLLERTKKREEFLKRNPRVQLDNSPVKPSKSLLKKEDNLENNNFQNDKSQVLASHSCSTDSKIINIKDSDNVDSIFFFSNSLNLLNEVSDEDAKVQPNYEFKKASSSQMLSESFTNLDKISSTPVETKELETFDENKFEPEVENFKFVSSRKSIEPSSLPISARRAIFEEKIKAKSNGYKNLLYSSKAKDSKVEKFETYQKSESKKSRIEVLKDVFEDRSPPKTKEKNAGHFSNFCTTFQESSNMLQFSSNDESETDSKPNFEFSQDKEVQEALEAFKEIDDYSIVPSECSKNISPQEIQKFSLIKPEASDESDISSLLDNIEDVDSPMGSSTKLYPEVMPLDETTLEAVPTKLRLKTKSPKLSPIFVSYSKDLIENEQKKINQVSELKIATPIRTLSMYRREQKLQKLCQDEKIIYSTELTNETKDCQQKEAEAKFEAYKKSKVVELQAEAKKYNEIISQSLLALRHCIGVKNASERIEAEKILLISLKKREAIVNHIYHLKDEANFYDNNLVLGNFNINNLLLGVKKEFLLSVTKVGGHDSNEHHFICLFTCGDKLSATECLSSSQALQEAVLQFPVKVNFDQLSNKFEVKMEVYSLTLPKQKGKGNEKKFGSIGFISKSKSKQSVYSNFKLLGHFTFNVNNFSQKRYSFQNFDSSLLENSFLINISLSAKYNMKYKCYLSFKEKSSEFWVWNRKWCVLDGYLLHFWRYYEDEDSKSSLGVINMKECVNRKISKASSNISMRENCFSFVTVAKGNSSLITFYLLAADLRSEMDEWLKNLNFILENIRIWESDAAQPWDDSCLEKWVK